MGKKNFNENSGTRACLKFLCLVSLTLQNTAYTLLLKYALLQDKLFISSTAIFMAEILKVFSSLLLMVLFERSWKSTGEFLYQSVAETPLDTLNVMICAITYVIMNNLMYISGLHLDVITYQIINQIKIPMTVVFSIIILRSTFRRMQYVSILLLTAGVVIVVQFTEIKETKKFVGATRSVGYITGSVASALSGFAGVYFEKILKTSQHSVWSRNLQLSLISVPAALLQAFIYDGVDIREKGFFYGYTYIVWILIFIQASGGLTVALSVKLTDNVSKGYATSASIILSGIISVILFHYHVHGLYIFGTGLVVLSIPMYAISFSFSNKIKSEKIDYEGKECYI